MAASLVHVVDDDPAMRDSVGFLLDTAGFEIALYEAGTDLLDTLVKPENKDTLTKILTYHVVPGRMTAKDLMAKIKADGGKTTLTTVEGEPLTASMMGNTLMLTDAKGGMSHVTIKDVMQSNGVIHVVDTVLMP